MLPSVSVSYGRNSVQIPLAQRSVRHVTAHAVAALAPHCPSPVLAFETACGDQAAVCSDFALRLVLSAHPSAGRLVLVSCAHVPTVDQCMSTVLRAVVDTAARGEVAAVFLALSGAWELACRELAECSNVSTPSLSPSPSSPSSPPLASSPAPAPPPPLQGGAGATAGGDAAEGGFGFGGSGRRRATPLQTQFHSCLTSALDSTLGECSRQLADAACGSAPDGDAVFETGAHAASERRAVACFCTHTGVSCAACNVQAIEGTRYRSSAAVNFCERCRRSLPDASDACFTVFDHPWEATDDYAQTCGDVFKAPRPPLRMGDVGPRVMHLQYVLHRVGFLNVCDRRFRAGVFCAQTRRALRALGSEHRVAEPRGVYTALLRRVLLALLDELERRRAAARCAAVDAAGRPRFRTAMAA